MYVGTPTTFTGDTDSYDFSYQSVARYLDTDTLLYLDDYPVLTPCECIYECVSPGPARDLLILRILRAGHRADVFDLVRAQRSDLWRRHLAARTNAERITSAIQRMET